eukprot:2583518-Prymnesium_polylepis.1
MRNTQAAAAAAAEHRPAHGKVTERCRAQRFAGHVLTPVSCLVLLTSSQQGGVLDVTANHHPNPLGSEILRVPLYACMCLAWCLGRV